MGDMKKFRARKVHADKLLTEDKLVSDGAVVSVKSTEKVEKVKNVSKKKLRTKKIRMSMTKAEEKKLDKELEIDNKVSTVFIVVVLGLSFVVGITLGYILYKIALTGSI